MGKQETNRAAAVGGNPPRTDGPSKVKGEALYFDDLAIDGVWHGKTIRSPHAKGRLLSLDVSRARELEDVVVVAAEDLPRRNVLQLINDDWRVLVDGVAQHYGEAVCLIAASTKARAAEAVALVEMEWEELEPVIGFDAALVGLEEGPRVLATCGLNHGDVQAAFAAADHIIEATYETGHQEHAYIENQGIIATASPDGALDFIGSIQCPYYVHQAMVEFFDLKPEQVRVRQAVTGGGFGGKEDYPDLIAAHAALLARAAGHPVKIAYDRNEDIIATTKRHPARIRHKTGVKADGTLVAMEIDVLLDGGAYTTLSPVVLSRGVIHGAGAYRCPNVKISGQVLATNTVPNGAFRGFGAPQTLYAVERHIDRIARELGLDPLTIRELNAYRVGDTTPTGQVLTESVSALECLEAAAERTDFRRKWMEYEQLRATNVDVAAQSGIGISLFWHGTGFTGNGERVMRSPATIDLQPGGRVRVRVSSTDFGQGTETVLAQITADAVGIPFESIDVVQPDTSMVPDSGPTVASRTVMIVGGVLEHAGKTLARAISEFATSESDAGELRIAEGMLVDEAGKQRGAFAEWGDKFLGDRELFEVTERFEGDETTFDEETYQGTAYACYGWGCNVVEVDVDADTLVTKPRTLTMAVDVGKAIHPTLCAGQVEGGTLQAIAWGYMEEIKFTDGRIQNDRLQTYIIPTSQDVPAMDTILIENPGPGGPSGAKGVGELPMDGGAPAIVAAIENATGIAPRNIPATPENLLSARENGLMIEGKTA